MSWGDIKVNMNYSPKVGDCCSCCPPRSYWTPFGVRSIGVSDYWRSSSTTVSITIVVGTASSYLTRLHTCTSCQARISCTSCRCIRNARATGTDKLHELQVWCDVNARSAINCLSVLSVNGYAWLFKLLFSTRNVNRCIQIKMYKALSEQSFQFSDIIDTKIAELDEEI